MPFTLAQLERNPDVILRHISDRHARFSALDIKRSLAKFMDDPLVLRKAIDRALASDALIALADDNYTTKDYRQTEAGLLTTANAMAQSRVNTVRSETLRHEMAAQNTKMHRAFGGHLSDEQEHALRHICNAKQLACVVGLAGTGKSTLL